VRGHGTGHFCLESQLPGPKKTAAPQGSGALCQQAHRAKFTLQFHHTHGVKLTVKGVKEMLSLCHTHGVKGTSSLRPVTNLFFSVSLQGNAWERSLKTVRRMN
jgi:hypothetical protein